jgi:hypothetical protein
MGTVGFEYDIAVMLIGLFINPTKAYVAVALLIVSRRAVAGSNQETLLIRGSTELVQGLCVEVASSCCKVEPRVAVLIINTVLPAFLLTGGLSCCVTTA